MYMEVSGTVFDCTFFLPKRDERDGTCLVVSKEPKD